MLETAIIGAGVCGLSLARALHARHHDCTVFEARDRIGGRVLTERCALTGASVDLGPTWFWPDTQPLMCALIDELGLAHFPQYADGDLLILHDPDKKPTQQATGQLHGSARRIAHGMGSLVAALAVGVPSERIRLGHELVSLTAEADHVRLTFRTQSGELVQRARRVVLAIPPRLAAEHVTFEPPLSTPLRSAIAQTPTWMASHAKAVLTVTSPRWRAHNLSGSAFVTHERAVLAEVFDATDPHATGAALGGFLALAPAQRAEFRTGLPMLIGSQASQLFGAALEGAHQYVVDWGSERFTCSTRDLHEPPSHEDAAHPALRETHWAGRLFFGGSESASYAPGYLEGALDAARRLRRDVEFVAALSASPAPQQPAAAPPVTVDNGASLEAFARFARGLAERAFGSYRDRVARALAQQDTELLTQRAVLGAVEASYREALDVLESLPFDGRTAPIEAGRSALTPVVQAALGPFHPALFDQVVRYNGGSCALSNFSDEHALPRDYLRAIERDVAAAFREFCRAANAILVAKRG